MSSIQKAGDFIKLLKLHGWKGKFDKDSITDYAKIWAKREAEQLEISWINNQLTGPPKYWLADTEMNLHSAAVARRIVTGQPDMQAYLKRRRRKAKVQRAEGDSDSPTQETFRHELPFTPESSDKEILRAIRGSTIIWKNRISGLPESAFVPKDSNRDLNNVFYVAESSEGRPFVSFISQEGTFRAVALDSILQVR